MKFLDNDALYEPHILFDDNHLCIAVKPPGMAVPIENSGDESLEGFLLNYYRKKLCKETIFLQPIHRLDKPVGGIVIFARSSKALQRMQEAQRQKEIAKFYLAKVHGKIRKNKAILKHFLIHGDHEAHVVESGGKEAQLKYICLEKNSESSLLMIQLLTGRYHQIRVQLSTIGHPVIGDQKYGSWTKMRQNKILLYHTKISFVHPVTKKRMVFKVRPTFFKQDHKPLEASSERAFLPI